MFKIMSCAGLVVLLLGCASLDKPVASVSCSQNWKELGMKTAQDLEPVRTFDTYIEQCGSNLDSGAKAAFVDGYARALIDICNYDKGFQLGAENRAFPNVCPLEVQAEFQKGYVLGKRDYDQKMRNLKKISDDRDQREILPHNKGTRYGITDSQTATDVGP